MITKHFFKNTPSNLALSYFSLYLDYIYPRGGTGLLPNKVEDGRSFVYKNLIWAADQKSLYIVVNCEETEAFKEQRKMVEGSKGAESVFKGPISCTSG